MCVCVQRAWFCTSNWPFSDILVNTRANIGAALHHVQRDPGTVAGLQRLLRTMHCSRGKPRRATRAAACHGGEKMHGKRTRRSRTKGTSPARASQGRSGWRRCTAWTLRQAQQPPVRVECRGTERSGGHSSSLRKIPVICKGTKNIKAGWEAVLGIACDRQSIVNDFDENNLDAAIASVPGRPHPCGLLSHTNKDFTLESGTKKKKGWINIGREPPQGLGGTANKFLTEWLIVQYRNALGNRGRGQVILQGKRTPLGWLATSRMHPSCACRGRGGLNSTKPHAQNVINYSLCSPFLPLKVEYIQGMPEMYLVETSWALRIHLLLQQPLAQHNVAQRLKTQGNNMNVKLKTHVEPSR